MSEALPKAIETAGALMLALSDAERERDALRDQLEKTEKDLRRLDRLNRFHLAAVNQRDKLLWQCQHQLEEARAEVEEWRALDAFLPAGFEPTRDTFVQETARAILRMEAAERKSDAFRAQLAEAQAARLAEQSVKLREQARADTAERACEDATAANAELSRQLNAARRQLEAAQGARDMARLAGDAFERQLEAARAELEAALRDLLAHDFADECQECGIGRSDAWISACAVLARAKERA